MIRQAVIADRARVVDLLREFHTQWSREVGVEIGFSQAHVERMFLAHLRGGFSLALVCAGAGDVAQGVLLASAFEHPAAPVFIAKEAAWWITPRHRGREAIRMLDAYEDWARARKCVFAGMAGMGDDPDVAKLYRRRGYLGAETHYLKKL